MSEIKLTGVTKVFPDGTRAVSDVDLTVPDGQLMVLVGPSGCGKTTLLRMVAGLEHATEGEIEIGGQVVNEIPAKHRDIAMVFQNYALYPHMSVFDNMAFGLKLRGAKSSVKQSRVREAAAVLGLMDQLEKKPRELSGGQRQRVAMGRAIVRQPQAFLMDEPLSNLDAKLRVHMRAELEQLQRELGVTTIYVTHDQTEAMTLGDVVAVLHDGVVEQVDRPQALYRRPANMFVAAFVGSPAMNLLKATLRLNGGAPVVEFGDCALEVPRETLTDRPGLRSYDGRVLVIGIRPEHIADAAVRAGAPESDRLGGVVALREELGPEIYAHVEIDAPPSVMDDVRELTAGAESSMTTLHGRLRSQRSRLIARLDADATAQEGMRGDFVINTRALHYFDPDTGASVG